MSASYGIQMGLAKSILLNMSLYIFHFITHAHRPVKTAREVIDYVTYGMRHRAADSTKVHAHSSRSHLIVQLNLLQSNLTSQKQQQQQQQHKQQQHHQQSISGGDDNRSNVVSGRSKQQQQQNSSIPVRSRYYTYYFIFIISIYIFYGGNDNVCGIHIFVCYPNFF